MKLKDIIEFPYTERGERIVLGTDLYSNPGSIKVISSGTTGPMGYYNKANYLLKSNSFIYAIEGYAGMVSIYEPQEIWLTDVAGVVNIKQEFIDIHGKENIAILLQYYFVQNRHNNGQQPKFTLKRCLELEIDFSFIKQIKSIDLKEIESDEKIYNNILKYYKELKNEENKLYISFYDFIEMYNERGTRLVQGRDLYCNPGGISVISSTTTGAMGYYNKYNLKLKDNDFLYSIDGANAGYIMLTKSKRIWLTDHAGIVRVKKEYLKKYGKASIAIFLQMFFINSISNTGSQPKFVIKSILNKKIDLYKLEVLSKMNLDDALK